MFENKCRTKQIIRFIKFLSNYNKENKLFNVSGMNILYYK